MSQTRIEEEKKRVWAEKNNYFAKMIKFKKMYDYKGISSASQKTDNQKTGEVKENLIPTREMLARHKAALTKLNFQL